MTLSKKLSRRQIEVLMCTYLRRYTFGSTRFIDLLGDIGVSIYTLTDHLDALAARELILPSPYVNRKTMVPTFRYKNHQGVIELTKLGENTILQIMIE